MDDEPFKSGLISNYKVAPAALVGVSGKDRLYLQKGINIIGRGENVSIRLPEYFVSRKHCVISILSGNVFTIRDYSASGTFVNGKRLEKNVDHQLQHKDTIKIGGENKYTYTLFINKNLKMPLEQGEYLNSQMQEKMSSLDNSHSFEMSVVNDELHKIDTDKCCLQKEMSARLKAQEESFKSEKLALSNLVNLTKLQKDEAEQKLKVMTDKFEAEEKELKDEVDRKYANMVKKEEELQNLKVRLELQHQKARQELEERCQAEIEELKLKLAMSEIKHECLQEETRDAKKQLAESKQTLLESEIEQTRLVNEKDEVETKLIDLTKESTEKDDVVRDLKRKLKEKEREEQRRKDEMEKLEEHLMCSICTELFIEPIVLNCGHMFCKTCINEWKTKKRVCPMCRSNISVCVQVYNLDSIIEKNVAMLSSEAKEHREKLINDRKKGPTNAKKKTKGKSVRSSPYERRIEPPQPVIPMPETVENIIGGYFGFLANQNEVLADPFTFRFRNQRRLPVSTAVAPNQVEEVDLTNIPQIEPNTPRRRNASATFDSTIDLTTP